MVGARERYGGREQGEESPVRVCSLYAGYRDRTVLNGVTLEIPPRSVTVLTGPGGGGKTTFVRAMIGAETCDGFWYRGEIELSGARVSAQRQVPASPGSVLGTLLAPRASGSRRATEARAALRSVWPPGTLIHDLLEPHLETPADMLSRWHHRLAAFTRTVGSAADLYVFDEPDADAPRASLDPLAESIRRLRHRATVLVVTHNLALARKVSDFVVLIAEGVIVETADSRRFFSDPMHPRTFQFVKLGN